MGKIFLEAALRLWPAEAVVVLERTPDHAAEIEKKYGVRALAADHYDCSTADLVILAVKPQDSQALAPLLGTSAQSCLVLSMMAGIDLTRLQHLTGSNRIVRCMPNTPANIGTGMTVWTATPALTAADRALVEKMLQSFGQTVWVESDDWIDKATAVSGSGPAYVLAYAEYLVAAAQALGFSAATATVLVQQTMAGTVALWQNSHTPPADLRTQVTAKGGTTAAALAVLTEAQLDKIITRAVAAAYQRAQELRQQT